MEFHEDLQDGHRIKSLEEVQGIVLKGPLNGRAEDRVKRLSMDGTKAQYNAKKIAKKIHKVQPLNVVS